MIVTVGKNGAIPIPNDVNTKNKFKTGDILLCTLSKDGNSIVLERHKDQTLSDKEVLSHGHLTRVEELNPKDFE